jgi:hypothetical protein
MWVMALEGDLFYEGYFGDAIGEESDAWSGSRFLLEKPEDDADSKSAVNHQRLAIEEVLQVQLDE